MARFTAAKGLPVRRPQAQTEGPCASKRWLATEPRILILDEPTRGIDVGAHAEIIRLIRSLCDSGLAMLVISSEVEEIVSYSDRVTVLRDGSHVAHLTGEAVNEQRVLAAIAAD